jgi:hypothetical protein
LLLMAPLLSPRHPRRPSPARHPRTCLAPALTLALPNVLGARPADERELVDGVE